MEAIAAVGALKFSVALQARVDIATGLVVVGDLIGSGEAHERGIVGETPNVAHVCKVWLSPTRCSSPRAREGSWAICLT